MVNIEIYRHSVAHLVAQTVQRSINCNVQLGTGPCTENGCYYDILFPEEHQIKESDLKQLTKSLQLICKEPQLFKKYTCTLIHGYEINALTKQKLKNELLDKFSAKGETEISYYLNVVPNSLFENMRNVDEHYKTMYTDVTNYFRKNGTISEEESVTFLDLCTGPHIEESTKEIVVPGGIQAYSLAGAYRQADEKNVMMTRIYVHIFPTKEELKAYHTLLAEAKKRDHRILGEQLNLFTISPLVGAGMPLLQPNGMVLRTETIDYLRELHKKRGYKQVWTPHLAKEDLYITSGHAEKFGDELFKVKGKDENDNFYMKPMNCPHHMQIFADNQFSYRDMPIRYFEPGTVYRDEKKGQLSGLTRVRSITQDDGHLFCRVGQLKEEVSSIVEIIKTFYGTLGMIDEYWVSLSVRGDDGKMYLGSDENREAAESALEETANEMSLPFKRIEGEAAFYGPKLDFMFKDALGRERQLSTIQVDFNLPERFDLSYINEQGEKERPVVIHRAVSGSIERFMGVMIEHFAGAFPVRLAPIQVIIVPVADTFVGYGDIVYKKFQEKGLRCEIDTSSDSLNKKIRNAEKKKIPYILVVGEKEESSKTVNVREYKTKDQYELDVDTCVETIYKTYIEKTL